MIWVFDRRGEKIAYEICRDEEGFLLVMTSATGQKRVERVVHATELIERSIDQMRRLQDDGWKVG